MRRLMSSIKKKKKRKLVESPKVSMYDSIPDDIKISFGKFYTYSLFYIVFFGILYPFILMYYLNKIFKKIMGKTIFVYLNEIRIQHACKLLATTSMKVAAIGYRVGYQDEYYFSKVFKKYTGVSPGQYEKMNLQLTQEQIKPL